MVAIMTFARFALQPAIAALLLLASGALTAPAAANINGARALAALREDTRVWWEDQLRSDPDDYDEGETPFRANTESLGRFLEGKVMPWYAARRRELDNRPMIRAQAFGDALSPDRLVSLIRYEVHLDRKLERTVAMLLKLQELRRAADPS